MNGSYATGQTFVDGMIPAMRVGAIVVAVGAVVALFLGGRARAMAIEVEPEGTFGELEGAAA